MKSLLGLILGYIYPYTPRRYAPAINVYKGRLASFWTEFTIAAFRTSLNDVTAAAAADDDNDNKNRAVAGKPREAV